MKYLFNFKAEIIVFTTGMSIMILELVGSRLLAPFLGTSIYVWTSLIGVILASLSIGYWLGGRFADKNPSYFVLSILLFVAAFFVGVVPLIQPFLLEYISETMTDLRVASVQAGILLFAIPSIALAAVSPYVVRLKVKEVETSGKTMGNLYAISTIGSIIGTFLAGFVLIAYFDNTQILLVLAVILAILGVLIHFPSFSRNKLVLILILFAVLYLSFTASQRYRNQIVAYVDTPYQSLQVYDGIDQNTGNQTRYLRTDTFGIQGAVFKNKDGLVFSYLKFFDLAEHFQKEFSNVLMIGAGAYAYPRDFLSRHPTASIDIVEIDQKVTEVSEKYFDFEPNKGINIFHEDGRTFVNKADKKYDVVFLDAFQSSTIPYQLTTKEFLSKIENLLTDDGLIVTNIISSINGDQGKFLRASFYTHKEVFPQVYLFPVQRANQNDIVQNLILIATKREKMIPTTNSNPEINFFLKNLWGGEIKKDLPILTDSFAPVDNYTLSIFN